MAKYYYDKYTIKRVYTEGAWDGDTSSTNRYHAYITGMTTYQGWKWDSSQSPPVFVGVGTPRVTNSAADAEQHVGRFEVDGSTVREILEYLNISDAERMTYRIRTRPRLIYSESKGDFVERVIAEDGTYPPNGINFFNWYVRGEMVNTAPTTPGAISSPMGTLEIGDSKVVAWGASSDAEGNLKNYVLEASINGGAFAVIASPTTTSFTYTVPSATSVKFRVKAVDTAGLSSAYKDSVLFTVSKPMYYWSKYNVVPSFVIVESGPVGEEHYSQSFTGHSNYVWDTRRSYFTKNLADSGTFAWAKGRVVYNLQDYDTKIRKSTGTDNNYWQRTDLEIKTGPGEPGSLIQSNITAIEGTYPPDGKHTDGFWYVRGSRVSQSIAPPAGFTSPASNVLLSPKQSLTLTFGASTAPSISTYEVEHRYNEGAWTAVGTHSNTLTRPFTVTENKTLTKVEFRVRAKNTSNVYSDYVYSESFTIEHNRVPTITLNTEKNVTLYENDTFKIDGSGLDLDIGDILNIYYRINGGLSRAIAVGISKGTSIPFNEQLLFKGGVLYEGETAVTDALAEGPAHRLEVWSEDNQGGKSTIAERTFYVVPNRAPSLTVDPFTDQSGMIDNDTIKFSGVSSDPDRNDVTVKYRVNEQAAVQIHSGPAGAWSFDLSFKLLKDGENTIVVEVTDTHNFKSSKTIKLNKTANLTPLEQSVQRYKIPPPAGTAQGVFLWIIRDKDQEVLAEISMTTGTEQEQYVPLTLDTSGPSGDGIEDFFKLKVDAPAENIILKLSWTGDKPIIMISGALLQ